MKSKNNDPHLKFRRVSRDSTTESRLKSEAAAPGKASCAYKKKEKLKALSRPVTRVYWSIKCTGVYIRHSKARAYDARTPFFLRY